MAYARFTLSVINLNYGAKLVVNQGVSLTALINKENQKSHLNALLKIH